MSEMNAQLPRDAIERAVAQVKMKPVTLGDNHGGHGGAGGTAGAIARLRDRHHMIARLVAQDIEPERICKVMGMTQVRLDMLVEHTPAFQELIAHYKKRNIPAKHAQTEEFVDLLERNMIAAEHEIADRLAEAADKLSVSELHKISRDSADRLGFSKHSVNLNVNVTLKDRLEGLRRRSRGAPAGAGSGGGDVSNVARSAPPLLELQANPAAGAPIGSNPGEVNKPHQLGSPSAGDPDAPMSRDQVLAIHRAALENRRNTTRREPAPDREPIKRRV